MSARLNMKLVDQINAANEEVDMPKKDQVQETQAPAEAPVSPFEDVPLPENARGSRGMSEVGQLFHDCPDGKSFRHPNAEAKIGAVQQQCFSYGKKFGKKFICREVVESGKKVIRVWRKA